MGNKIESIKSLEDLKKNLRIFSNADMDGIKGGKGKKPSSNKWNISLGGITPQ